jgi:hypothetical protein
MTCRGRHGAAAVGPADRCAVQNKQQAFYKTVHVQHHLETPWSPTGVPPVAMALRSHRYRAWRILGLEESGMSNDQTVREPNEIVRVNEQKWGRLLMSAGYTVLPDVIFIFMHRLGLDEIDLTIVLNLGSFWWYAENLPRPAVGTIAERMHRDLRTIQRRIAAMEKRGYLLREQRRIKGHGSKANVYHLDGLIKAAERFAKERLEDIELRKQAKQLRLQRRGRPKLRVV